MQLVRLPAWLYILIGLVLIVIGLAGGRLPVAVIGVVAIIAGVVRVVWSRG
jgi:membrane protein implicated in regulation of membrane protease activity